MKTRIIVTLSAGVWLAVVSFGLGILCNYEITPGKAAIPEVMWPQKSRIRQDSNRATLVMLAHPKCPCSRASIGELARLMAHSQGKVASFVLFLKPQGVAANWEKTDLWRSAAAIPGVRVLGDEKGREAQLFRATTSGQTLLFDKQGRLLFSGGITGSRGHSGDNAGLDAVVSLLNSGKAQQSKTLVFGCSLIDSNAS
jgi:hypothetical protein